MNRLLLLFAIAGITVFASCKKCYQCHNVCKTCIDQRVDTTLTIKVCSDRLSEKYYNEYIDSLTSPNLGWQCSDAASDYYESYCESQSKSAVTALNKKEAGLVCTSE